MVSGWCLNPAMRVKGASFQQFLLGMALLGAVCWNLAHAGELRGIQLSTGPTGTRAELRMDTEAGYQLIALSNPDRLVVDLPGSHLRTRLQLPSAAGVVRAVRSGQPEPGTTRIVFDLAGAVSPLKPHYEPGVDGPRLVLEWPGDGDPGAAQAAAAATSSDAQPAAASAEATSRPASSLPSDPMAVPSAETSTATRSPATASVQPATAPALDRKSVV